jgi:BRCT domain type II-containing protein
MLEGMLLGFAADGRIDDLELASLGKFLDNHAHLLALSPFAGVLREYRCAVDPEGEVSERGRQHFLAFCCDYEPSYTDAAPDDDELRELHGFLSGVVADGVLEAAELDALVAWLRRHEHLLTSFPCLHLAVLLQNVLLARGDHARSEAELVSFCLNLTERVLERPATVRESFEGEWWAQTRAPVCCAATGLCDESPAIVFPDHTFCFTGRARTGQRSVLEALVQQRGGVPRGSVSASIDYLVIGDESSPAWMFASYGRKIETAMNLRLQGHRIAVVSETDFEAAARSAEVTPAPRTRNMARQDALAPDGPLAGRSVVFTGRLASMDRRSAQRRAQAAGAATPDGVTKDLSILVIGDDGSPLLGGGRKSSKHEKAEKLNAQGGAIEIISEAEFLRRIS